MTQIKVKSARTAPNHTAHHKAAPSRALMRKAVKKPGPSLKRKLRVTPALDIGLSKVVLDGGAITNFKRPKRDTAIKKSPRISHFISLANQTPPVAPLFNTTPNQPVIIEPTKNHSSLSSKPAPVKSSLDLLLERGLERATSHLEPSPKIRKRKRHLNTLAITSVVAVVLTAVTLLGTNTI